MKPFKNKALIIFILVVIAIGGFVFGRSFYQTDSTQQQPIAPKETPSHDKTEETSDTAIQTENAIDYKYLRATSYVAGHPSVGPLITTVNAKLDPINQIIQFSRNTPSSEKIALKNKVILMNKDGSIDLRDVEIGFIGETDQNGYISAGLNFDCALDKEQLGDIATIITKETYALKRLPLSAVRKDENGDTYVWRVTPIDKDKKPVIFSSADTLLLNKTAVDTTLNDNRFFEAPISVMTTDLVILNPDDALQENTIIPTVSIQDINAPSGSILFEARMKAAIESAAADIANSIENAAQCVADAQAITNAAVAAANIDEGDITGKQSTRAQANELPPEDSAGACGASASAGSCGAESAGSCGGGDSAGSCGGDSDAAGSCGGAEPSACGADPYLSDFNAPPPLQMVDPYILLGIQPLSSQ